MKEKCFPEQGRMFDSLVSGLEKSIFYGTFRFLPGQKAFDQSYFNISAPGLVSFVPDPYYSMLCLIFDTVGLGYPVKLLLQLYVEKCLHYCPTLRYGTGTNF